VAARDAGPGELIGKRITSRNNRKLVRGRASYVGDVRLPDMHHVAIVRSPHAHALIRGVDTAAAEALPGVLRVVIGEEIVRRTNPIPEGWDSAAVGAKRVDWYALAARRVRFVGEAVAAVVAGDAATAERAAALIDVDYDVRAPVMSAAAALDDGAPLVEPAWGDNMLFEQSFDQGDVAAELASANGVVRGVVASQRLSGLPLEPRGIVATFDGGERCIRMWESTQQPHLVRAYVAQALGVAERSVIVTMPQVGGAFGLKQPTSQEEVLMAYLAKEVRRPVRWIEQRSEGLSVGGHARETTCSYEAAHDDNGVLTALRVDIVADVGAPTAFLGWGMSVVTMFTLPTVYKVPNISVRLRSVVTNKGPWTPCRGFGKDVATVLMERVLDHVADAVGLDRVETRLRNLIGPDEFPYRHVSGGVIDSGDYPAALARVADAIGYRTFDREQQRARAEGRRLGLGIAMELTPEGVAVAGSLMNNGYDGATVRITPTGDVTVLSGVTSPGTGNETGLAQIAADALNCSIDRVSVVQGDTDACPWGLGNYSSRSIIIGGSAVQMAAGQLADKLHTVAASMLGADPDNTAAHFEGFHVDGRPDDTVDFDAVVRQIYWHALEEHSDKVEPALEATRYYRIGNINHTPADGDRQGLYPTWASGAVACVVEVDEETGHVKVLRYHAVEDAGRIINPLLADAQLHGGIAFAIGTALYERISYDDDGQLLTGTLMDYTIPTAVELPLFGVEHQESLSPFTPHGTKGVGESGLGGTIAALCSAIENAFPDRDLRLCRLPLTPAAVWAALHGAVSATGSG